MGSIHLAPLDTFIAELAVRHGIAEFVETGTYQGDGCAFAAGIFPRTTTIEIRPDFHEAAKARLAHTSIRFLLGDSRDLLGQLVPELTGPTLFWLDGHAGGGHFGPEDNCPLLDELNAIARSPHRHFILVDDARAFLAPPPPPFDPAKWPTLVEVIEAGRQRHPYHCVVIADTMMFLPEEAKEEARLLSDKIRPVI